MDPKDRAGLAKLVENFVAEDEAYIYQTPYGLTISRFKGDNVVSQALNSKELHSLIFTATLSMKAMRVDQMIWLQKITRRRPNAVFDPFYYPCPKLLASKARFQ